MSSENLTQMAIDIASGLQYLHHLKYVHRSVAESNSKIVRALFSPDLVDELNVSLT